MKTFSERTEEFVTKASLEAQLQDLKKDQDILKLKIQIKRLGDQKFSINA